MNLTLSKMNSLKNSNHNYSENMSIVLVSPENPKNIGAVARAMNNMGFSDLRLVNPCNYLSGGEEGARTLAMHSYDILSRAKIYSSLKEALADKQIMIATTKRSREQYKHLESSWNLPLILSNISKETKIAFVFGRETSGLTNAEMDFCNYFVSIPTFSKNSSLNLAQAVMVILYETSKIKDLNYFYNNEITCLANSDHIERLKENLFSLLSKINYIKSGNENKRRSVFSKIIAKKLFTEKEVNILQGVLNKFKDYIQ